MYKDKFGQLVLTENDICSLYLKDPDSVFSTILSDKNIRFSPLLHIDNPPEIIQYQDLSMSVQEFDNIHSNLWFMPDEYKKLDIAKWVLDKCNSDAELQRVGEELLLYQERDMFVLLQYLKYLVDTMRENNIVWGVGRGSSVSSFVLYLIGVHRINSLHYDLSIKEFLK